MDLIYKWLEKRLFKRRHEVMKLRFEKIRLQQELERLKEQHEKIDWPKKDRIEYKVYNVLL